MNNRLLSQTVGICSLLTMTAAAGPDALIDVKPGSQDGFAKARRPMSNPTLFDLALPVSNVHPLVMIHRLPDEVNTSVGRVPMGGDVTVYALQLEYALSERLSLVATKDGYVEIDPDATLSKKSGFANLGGGVKYAFVLDEQAGRALSGTLTFEAPTGNRDVFQGAGDGAVNLIVSGLQMAGAWQFAGGAGVHVPLSDQQATRGWLSTHVSYEVSPWFMPLVELNWFHVLDAGDGKANFKNQAGGAVPVIAEFEGGDLLNFGAIHARSNRDLVTAAIGFRSRLCASADFGVAYEIPLTNERDGIIEDRWTIDLVWRF